MSEIGKLFHMSAEFMQRLIETQAKMLQDVVEKMNKTGGDKKPMSLDERRFREIGSFDGAEEKWREWSSKFKRAAKEVNLNMFEHPKRAEEATEEMDPDEFDDDETEISAAVYNRLMMLVTGSAFAIHQSVMNQNKLKV